MLTVYSTKHLAWREDRASINHYVLIAYSIDELPESEDHFDNNAIIAQGSIAYVMSVSNWYMYNSNHVWVLQTTSSGEAGDYSELSNLPKINDITLLGNLSSESLGLQDTISDLNSIRNGASAGYTAVQPATLNTALTQRIESNTTEYWNSQTSLVSTANKLYIYTDYSQEDGHDIPAFKVGDGLAYLVDLPFSYMGNVTEEQIEFWNNKVTAYLDSNQSEVLILTKN